jgi:hypothetical protein
MYAKFRSYSAQCSFKLHRYVVRVSMLLCVHIVNGHSAQGYDVYMYMKAPVRGCYV